MKDILIIEHLRRGDEEAFKYIYERHYVLLCRFANQILNDASSFGRGGGRCYILFMGASSGDRNHVFCPCLSDARCL